MLKSELKVPLTQEQYYDKDLPFTLARNVADAVNNTLGTQHKGYCGFQGNGLVNISLI